MAYCTQADILEELSQQSLIELTDDTGVAVDTSIVTRCIEDADAEIDSYLGVLYDVPLSSTPNRVRSVSVTLSICYLYRRRVDEIPESRKEACERERKWLEAIGAGRATLGLDVPAPVATSGPQTSTDTADRVYTRGKNTITGTLDGF
jgi:phage gp36-like protein